MSLTLRDTARVRRLERVFDNPTSQMQLQIARLCVLYEDFRIETGALFEDSLPPCDTVSVNFRKLYFMRRASLTVHEMSGAIHVLSMDAEFKGLKRTTFGRERMRQWVHATRTLERIHRTLGDERNLYGGHFHDDAARFALGHLSDSVGLLSVHFNRDGTHNTVLKFVETLAGLGLVAHRGETDTATFLHDTIKRLWDAAGCAATVVHLLDEVFISPRFGLGS